MSDSKIDRIRAKYETTEDQLGTHWVGCEVYHWGCGVAVLLPEVDRLRAEVSRLTHYLEVREKQVNDAAVVITRLDEVNGQLTQERDRLIEREAEICGEDVTYEELIELLRRTRDGWQSRAEQAEAANQWRPIETAPKDAVILVHDEGHVGKAMFDPDTGKWLDLESANHPYDPAPQHWMPLPAIPATPPLKGQPHG